MGIYLSFMPGHTIQQADSNGFAGYALLLKISKYSCGYSGYSENRFPSGFYPAAIISKVKPASIFGESSVEKQMKMRNELSLV